MELNKNGNKIFKYYKNNKDIGNPFNKKQSNGKLYINIRVDWCDIFEVMFSCSLISSKYKNICSILSNNNINIYPYLKINDNNNNNNYLNFNNIINHKNNKINYKKINSINNNKYYKITYDDYNNKIGLFIHKSKRVRVLIFNDNKHNYIPYYDDYNDNDINIDSFISCHNDMYINNNIFNEYNLFKYFINYLIFINNKQKKIYNIILNNFIQYLYNYKYQKHHSLTYWLDQIICKNYNDRNNIIYKQFIFDYGRELFLLSSKLSNKSNCIQYIKYDWYAERDYKYDLILIDSFIFGLINYTKTFYNNLIKICNKICKNCNEKITINTYGFDYWENSFIYPWDINKCKVCGYNLNNNNNNNNNNSDYNIILYNELNNKLYLSRLIKIMNAPYINKLSGKYNYNILYKYILNVNNKYNFIDIINDYNILLKNNLSYKYLLYIKNNILQYKCNINNCLFINNIYRNRNKNNKKYYNTKIILLSKIHMSLYHFDIYNKRYRNIININNNNNNNKFGLINFNINNNNNNNNKINKLINNNDYIQYSYGDGNIKDYKGNIDKRVLHYYKIPNILYSSFYSEMLSNKIYKLSYKFFLCELNKSKIFINTKDIKDMESNNAHLYYGLIYKDQMKISNILSILFYCNYTELCQLFRKEFFINKYTQYYTKKDKWGYDIKYIKNIEYYYFSRNLYITIEYYGIKSDNIYNSDNDIFYSGLNKKFLFESYGNVFTLPLSVTKTKKVANKFAGDNGIVIQIKSKWKYNNDNYWNSKSNNTRYMSLKLLSNYGEFEDECLYFGGNNELRIINIIDLNDKNNGNKLYKYIKTIIWFQKTLDLFEWKYYDFYANLLSLLLNKSEQNILIIILNGIINNNNNDNKIPLYIQHLYKYFCLKKQKIDITDWDDNEFIKSFNSFLSLFFDDDCDYNKLDYNYYPSNQIKIKRLFENIIKYE